MAYTKQELARIDELFKKIEANKEHKYAAPTYKDRPALKEIEGIILSCQDCTPEVLKEKIPALWYLGECYDQMCRVGISLKFYVLLLEAHLQMSQLNEYSEIEMKQLEDAFYRLVRARNKYEKDECTDLIEMVKGRIPEEKAAGMVAEILSRTPWLPKNDPVELTEEYLAVIDEVEEKIERNKTMDFVLEYWNLKSEYLAEHDIYWNSPTLLNPDTFFD